MIRPYSKVSFIYGASGLRYAKSIIKKLKLIHDEGGYPIITSIFASSIIDSGQTKFDTVSAMLEESSVVIIILTFDDIQKTRVRQNVLVEIGMALKIIPKDKIYVFSEKDLPKDFPSDLLGAINVNVYNLENGDLADEIITLLNLESNKGLLCNQNYEFKYEEVFDGIPANVFEKKPELQMEAILEYWLKHIEEFSLIEERILYTAERLSFIPIFTANQETLMFLEKVRKLINSTRSSEETENEKVVDIVVAAVDYLILRTEEHEIIESSNQKKLTLLQKMDYCYKTKNLSEILKNTIDLIKNEELNVNWFIKVICYNYASLTILHECTLGQLQLKEHIKNLQSVAEYLKKVIILTNKHCSESSELWDGYAQYNLCRVYQSLYNVDDVEKKPFYLEEITKTSYKAIESRKRLIYANFKGIFSNAILFEYFLALKNKYEFNMNLEGYAHRDQIIEQIDNTMIELNKYCEISGLIKLINLREQLCNMKEEVKKVHNESDNINNQ